MQTSRKIPTRLLVFLYLPSVIDVGGKVTIDVVLKLKTGESVVSCHFLCHGHGGGGKVEEG